MSDAVEAFWQDVEQKAADECSCCERHGGVTFRSILAIVFAAEGDGLGVGMDQPAVGDGDAVGIAGELGEHGFGPSEGRLGVDHPFGLPQWREPGVEGLPVGETGVVAMECKLPVAVGLCQHLQEPSAEQA